jgi:hypothetical protein
MRRMRAQEVICCEHCAVRYLDGEMLQHAYKCSGGPIS